MEERYTGGTWVVGNKLHKVKITDTNKNCTSNNFHTAFPTVGILEKPPKIRKKKQVW